MIMRQSTEFDGKISFAFDEKVSNDPESQPIPLQSRPSRLACWELPRRTRSKRTLTTRRQVACVCASISPGTNAQAMLLLPSTLCRAHGEVWPLFYEPLVSGGNLLGVWVLPEEYRKIGFVWEMDTGKCFGIERRAVTAGPYTFMRQSIEVAGMISVVLYVKVSNDPESAPIPVQSRDFTALARHCFCGWEWKEALDGGLAFVLAKEGLTDFRVCESCERGVPGRRRRRGLVNSF